MSTLDTKQSADRISLFVATIEALDPKFKIPDQKKAREMMRKMLQGFPHHMVVAQEMIESQENLHGDKRKYEQFTVEEHDSVAQHWGGPMPPAMRRIVDLIAEKLPNARIWVYCTPDDPWIGIDEGEGAEDHELILGGWCRKSRIHPSRIIPL